MLSRLVAGAAVLAFAGTVWCAGPPSVTASVDAFEVVIRDFYGVEGYTYVYRLDSTDLVVSVENDVGRPAKELCRVPLPVDRSAEWGQFLATFPLETLAAEYADPAVDDGVQITFSVKRGGRPARFVKVANSFQADLAVLCDRVAALVPVQCVPQPLKLHAKR